ncbi:MAG: thioredoxin family protein [Planctomycetota bacterium]
MIDLRIGATLLVVATLTLPACQSNTGESEGSAGSDPSDTLSVEAGDIAAPAIVGEIATAELGATAPEFVLADTSGTTHRLSDFRGNVVVLEWVNHGCPFVKKHYDNSDNMQTLQERYTDEGIVWLSICSSAPGKQGHMDNDGWAQSIQDRSTHQTAVLVDETGVVGKAFGARTTPHMYVIDAEGTLIYHGALDSNGSPDASTIEGADNYVADTLDAMLAGNEVEPFTHKPYGCSVKYAN